MCMSLVTSALPRAIGWPCLVCHGDSLVSALLIRFFADQFCTGLWIWIYIYTYSIYIYILYIYIFGSIFTDDIESIDGMAHCRQVDRFRADFVFAELRGCGGFGFYRFRLFLMQLLNWLSISLNATQYLRFP